MGWMNKKINFEIIAIFIIVYPFFIIPWDVYFITLTKLSYLIVFILALWTVYIFQTLKNRKPFFVPQTSGEKLALLFLFFICLSTIFARDPIVSLLGVYSKYQGLVAWFSYITLFLFFYHLIPINKQVNIIRMMFFASVFCGIYGIIQHYYFYLLIGKINGTNYINSWAFFDNPNHFGSYLVIMMILGMTMFLLAKSRGQSIVHGLILCILFLALLFTTTRGAWIATFFGGLVLTIFVVCKRRWLWKRWILLFMSLFIILLIVNISENNFFFNRINSVSNDIHSVVTQDNEEAGSGRWGIWERTFPIIKENILLGTGPNSFSIVFPLTAADNNSGLDNSHNDYIEIAMTMGVPALLVYLAFIFTILKSSFTAVKQLDGDKEIYLYGLIAAIIGYLIKVFFNISVVSVAPFFWIILGMCYAYSRNVETKTRN